MIVREQHRGNGYGRGLLDHAQTEARASGAHFLYVATYARNSDYLTLYISRRFVPVVMLRDMHGAGEDGEAYLRKILKDKDTDLSVPGEA